MARKYGPKASDKIGQTMHEFKRGKLKSGGSGKKVTSRKQAIAIGISQARRAGYKVPQQPPGHATMKASLDARVRGYLSSMRPGSEIDARGIARALGGVDPLEADYALERAQKAGVAVTSDGRWFGPRGGSAHARKKSQAEAVRDIAAAYDSVDRIKRDPKSRKTAAQLNREIAEALAGPRRGGRAQRAHATVQGAGRSLFAVEIDRSEFDTRKLPDNANWRDDLVPLAEAELARGRTHRRPKDARYAVIEWTGYRGAVGRLLDWLEATPGITRYAEIFE